MARITPWAGCHAGRNPAHVLAPVHLRPRTHARPDLPCPSFLARTSRDVEKSSGSGLKEILAARARQDEAEKDVATVSEQLAAANSTRKEAEKAAKDAKEVVVAAEKVLRGAIAAGAPATARK